MGTTSDDLEATLAQYLDYERVDENREYMSQLAKDSSRRDELQRLLGQRLLFGTAGIRGAMGPGYGQMNDLVIIQTSQGLAHYLLEQFGKSDCSQRGVIIGHDARHNSDRFARLAAVAFLQRGIRVYFSEHIVPTPVIAFGVRHYNCLAGIVVTASHNPKADNGYKVYWSNGAQILSPHDKNIQQSIVAQLRPSSMAWLGRTKSAPELAQKFPGFSLIHREVVDQYMRFIETRIVMARKSSEDPLRIVYTTMHGVGHKFLTRALGLANFQNIHSVKAQQEPDPNFPTVTYPNPEEPGALELAFETASSTGSHLILANDPDADRCAAALFDSATGVRRVLTGNEIGSLLGWWLWHSRPNGGRPASDFCMLSTAVSSRFLATMARIEGFRFVETLTGFKYMGNEAERLMKEQRKEVLFAFEEAIGYMVSSELLDKDGITAAVQLAQCAQHLRDRCNRTLVQQLDWLYLKYGYHYSLNSYFLCMEPEKTKRIFKKLQADLPRHFGDFAVTRVRDLNLGYDSAQADEKPTLPTSSSSFMVSFFVGDEISFTIRTSGTEPKIKYYSEIVAPLGEHMEADAAELAKSAARDRLQRFVDTAIERCLEPLANGLTAAPTK